MEAPASQPAIISNRADGQVGVDDRTALRDALIAAAIEIDDVAWQWGQHGLTNCQRLSIWRQRRGQSNCVADNESVEIHCSKHRRARARRR